MNITSSFRWRSCAQRPVRTDRRTWTATAGALLDLCSQVTPIANKFLISDLAVCAELAMATVRCAAYNVRVNLVDVSDATERQHFEDAMNKIVVHGTETIRATMPAIWKRLG